MEMLSITIDGKKYEYVDSIQYQGKNYVALSDGEHITINEYYVVNEQIQLLPIDDILFLQLKEMMHFI